MRFLKGAKWRDHRARIKMKLDDAELDDDGGDSGTLEQEEKLDQGELESGNAGHSLLHITLILATAIGSLPALEANTQVERDREDDPSTNEADTSDNQEEEEAVEGTWNTQGGVLGVNYEEDHQAMLQFPREQNPYLLENDWTFARHVVDTERPMIEQPRKKQFKGMRRG
jgi:hypothetical protein